MAVWLLDTIESVTLLVCLPLKSPLNSYHHLRSRVFDKILSLHQIGSGQALAEPMCFFNCSTFQCQNNNIGLCYFTVVPKWPKSYHDTGVQGTFLHHLVYHRTLSKTLQWSHIFYSRFKISHDDLEFVLLE